MFNRLILGLLISAMCHTSVFAFTSLLEDTSLVEGFAKAFAITAERNDLEGAEKNPATIDFETKKRIMVNMNQSYDVGLKQGFIGLGYRILDDINVTFAMPFQLVDEINETKVANGSAVKLDEFSMMSLQPKVSIKVPVLPFLDLGASVRGYFDTVYEENSSGLGLDFGALIHLKTLTIGYAAQEIASSKRWSTGEKEVFNPSMHTGIKVQVSDAVALLADTSSVNGESAVNVASTMKVSHRLDMSAGIRDLGDTNQLRAGATLRFNKWKVNYAYGYHDVLNDSHKVGITIDY